MSAQNSSTTEPVSTLMPTVDTDICVVILIFATLMETALLLLAAWIVVVILVSRAHKNNIFIYHVLNLAIADILLGASMVVMASDSIAAPNSWGGLGTAAFSLELFQFSYGISIPAGTQHYLAMAVIAGERIYSVSCPLRAQGRGPPIGVTVALSIFFLINLVVTTIGNTIAVGSVTSYAQIGTFYFVVTLGNQYFSLSLIVATVVLYSALVIVVRRQTNRKIGAQPSVTATDMKSKRQAQITKTVCTVGAVYVATAFTFNVVQTIVNMLAGNGLIALGPWNILDDAVYIPLVIGQFCDLLIFAMKIEEIAKPSAKYLKQLMKLK